MTYLISDIHGNFQSFLKMLDKIQFDEDDKMYILGDVIDRGKENLKIINFIRQMDNMVLLKGNHEYFLQDYLKGELLGEQWEIWGGTETRNEVDRLSAAEQEELLTYIESLPLYKQLRVDGKTWTLTHSGYMMEYSVKGTRGLMNTLASIKKAVEKDEMKYLISQDIHYIPASVQFDSYLVVGHVPAIFLSGEAKILKTRRYMDIDAGNGHRKEKGRLACYCIESEEEFYI